MKTKFYLIIISIFLLVKVYSQDTISYLISPLNSNCPTGIYFQLVGDTLKINGTIMVKGCGKQVAVINTVNDSIIIKTLEIVNGVDCEIAYNACFAINLVTSKSDSIVNFNGIVYQIYNNNNTVTTETINYLLPLNDTFQLSLLSNPSTGYCWQWINKPSSTIIDTFGYKYIPDTPMLAGSGGKEIWNFRVDKAGIDTIELNYCQPWNLNSTVATNIIIVQVKDIKSSINPILINDKIKVYPNPTAGFLEIVSPQAVSKNYLLEVYDLNGMKLLSKVVNNLSESLDISSFSAGCYILNIIQDNHLIVQYQIIKI